MATKGKSTIGWFFGFKLHLIINDKGEIIQFLITQVHVDDREPLKNQKFHERIFGKLFADKGYISKDLFEKLFIDNIHLMQLTGLALEIVSKVIGIAGFNVIPKRWVVERTFGWFNFYRRLAKDYELNTECSKAFIHLTMCKMMLNRVKK